MKVNKFTRQLIEDYIKNAIHPYQPLYGERDMSISAATKAIIYAVERQSVAPNQLRDKR
jgi:hypothetical protein